MRGATNEDGKTDELEMIRSLLEAEQSKDAENVKQAQSRFLRARSDSDQDKSSFSAANNSNKTPNKGQSQANSKSKVTKQNSAISTGRSKSRFVSGADTGINSKNNVARLLQQKRHRQPVVVSPDTTVEQLAVELCKDRRNAALVRDDVSNKIIGILTDADICKRMVAKKKRGSVVKVSEIMTPNPVCVGPETAILEVFELMVKNRFRHLPVLDSDKETVYGLIDIAQCLYDAIRRIEKLQKSQVEFVHSVQRAHVRWSSSISDDPANTAALAQQMVDHIMQQIAPKVITILATPGSKEKDADSSDIVDSSITVQAAAEKMAKISKTAIIGLTTERFGIFTTKDLLSKVVAKGLNPEEVILRSILTMNPDTVDSESSLLDALHVMHEGKFLHVPIVSGDIDEGTEKVVGVLDVLDCAVHTFSKINPTLGQKHVNEFGVSEEDDDAFDTQFTERDREMFTKLYIRDDLSSASGSNAHSHNVGSKAPLNATNSFNVGVHDSISQVAENEVMQPVNLKALVEEGLSLKIKEKVSGKIFRLALDKNRSFEAIKDSIVKIVYGNISEKGIAAKDVSLFYVDEDGDEIALESDTGVVDAINLAKSQKWSKITLIAACSVINKSGSVDVVSKLVGVDLQQNGLIVAVVGLSAVVMILGAALLFFQTRKGSCKL